MNKVYINVEKFASRWADGESFAELARYAGVHRSTIREKIINHIDECCIKADDEK